MDRLSPGIGLIALLAATAVSSCAGCGEAERSLRVWAHHGQEAEHDALAALGRLFPGSVELAFFPDFQYSEKVSVAAAAGDVPDVLELDGPLVAKFAAAGLLAQLDGGIDHETRADFLPTILEQGTITGRLYALGSFESALVLYYDRALLERAGISPPADGEAWSWEELLAALSALRPSLHAPLALHLGETADEWFTYAFSPIVWSAGGRLIADDGATVAGVLDSATNVEALSRWQELFRRGFASSDPVDPDPFGSGTAALDWTGHWMARSHLAKKGTNLGVMPLPRMGERSVSTSGSWCWAISSRSSARSEAFAWLELVTDPRRGIAPIVSANGAIPSRRSAFPMIEELSRPPFSMFRDQLEHRARARPRTRHYAALTQHFAAALREIAHGAEVAERLHTAAASIQREIDRRERRP